MASWLSRCETFSDYTMSVIRNISEVERKRHMITIRWVKSSDAAWMQSGFDNHMGWTKPENYFAACCQQQTDGAIVLLVACDDDHYIGHVKVVWEPDYLYFRQRNIPEIQDLNVLPDYRRQGIAAKLVDKAEAIIKTRSPIAGIGFGLYADYGAAQRMYILRGYVPDGQGVSYGDEYVTPGQRVNVDDDLVLHLVKTL